MCDIAPGLKGKGVGATRPPAPPRLLYPQCACLVCDVIGRAPGGVLLLLGQALIPNMPKFRLCAAKALFSCPAIISQLLEPRITSHGPLENTEEVSKII